MSSSPSNNYLSTAIAVATACRYGTILTHEKDQLFNHLISSNQRTDILHDAQSSLKHEREELQYEEATLKVFETNPLLSKASVEGHEFWVRNETVTSALYIPRQLKKSIERRKHEITDLELVLAELGTNVKTKPAK